MSLPYQKKAQPRHKGYDEQSHKKDTQKWQGSSAEAEDGLFESEAGNEEIHPYGWCGVTDLQVGEEDDTKVEEVDIIPLGKGDDEWCHNNQGRIDIEQTPHEQKKNV